MQPEIEAKFLDVDHEQVRQSLRKLGGECLQPMRAMRRTNYEQVDGSLQAKNAFVRLRDEGDKVTLSYKQVNDLGAIGTHEVCVIVDDYDKTAALLEAAGFVAKSYQETRRESWRLGGAEIDLDEWPAIKPIVEIEAPDETTLWLLAKQLDVASHATLHGTGDYLYAHVYDVTTQEVNAWPTITFADTPQLLRGRERTAA